MNKPWDDQATPSVNKVLHRLNEQEFQMFVVNLEQRMRNAEFLLKMFKDRLDCDAVDNHLKFADEEDND